MMHRRLVIVSWPWGNFGISDHFRMLLDSIFLQKLERAKHEKRWKRIFATLLDGVKCGAGIKQDSICSYPSDILWYSFFTVKKIILPWKNVKEERQFTQMSNFDSFNARRPTRQPDPLFGAPRSARKFLFISWSSNLQCVVIFESRTNLTKIMTLNLECFGSSYLKHLDTKVFLGLNASKLQAQHEKSLQMCDRRLWPTGWKHGLNREHLRSSSLPPLHENACDRWTLHVLVVGTMVTCG